jgi:multidrug resistance efflux pump
MKVARAEVTVRDEELGELLAGTRAEEIAQARAELEEATQDWRLKTSGYRAEEIAAARAAATAAEQHLLAIRQQMAELRIAAPVAGTIETLELQPGDLVPANSPALSMIDRESLWVRAYVPEDRLNLALNQVVRVTVDSYPGETFRGHIGFIARQAEFTPSNIQTREERSKQVFRIKVQLEEGLDRLRPGMAADVMLEPPRERAGASPP